jgi:hypothetical protein
MRHQHFSIAARRFVLGCVGLLLVGCGPGGSDAPRGSSDPAAAQGSGSSLRQRQADFLNRIRESDPQYQTIQKALLNENNELGLILSRGVQLDSIPALMRAMLTQMAKEFPGHDLTIIAYAPSQPPARIGSAHLDAHSNQMTYTPEHPNRNL